MNIAIIYFSATGNTAKIANIISETLKEHDDVNVEDFDITTYSSRNNEINFDQFDAFFFGFPVYAIRAPKILREWLATLKDGNGRKASAFCTYGSAESGIVHHDFREILEKLNFQMVSSAEILAGHTYNRAGWDIGRDRPNQDDLNVAKEYTEKTYLRFKDSGLVKDQIQLDDSKLTRFNKSFVKMIARQEASQQIRPKNPSRNGQSCSMCRTCEENCPADAMDADSGEVDPSKCVACLRCVDNCPDEVLKFPDDSIRGNAIRKAGNLIPEVVAMKKSKYFL